MAGAVLHPAEIAGLAYVGGKLGTLVGADLANLGRRDELGQRLGRLSFGRASEPAAVQGVADRADGRNQRGGHQVGRNASDAG
jgi:hypothetical protein